jgi:sigma-B regulation protein RsbU (phosphoserine phosphatase)
MSVDVGRLYRWLGSSRADEANLSFSRILLFMLVSIGVLLLVIEVVALANGLALARTITTSVDELFSGTERVKSGDFDRRIPVRSDDQLGQLAASFNDMTDRIRHLLVEQDEKRRLEQELRVARDIQMSLLPHGSLTAPGLRASALCIPAREVGGDYYDFLPLADDRVGLLIADVSGKGTSAALYMAELKGLMLSLSRIHTSPRALLIEANRIISRHLDNRSFITMTYALFDPHRRTLTCARAGHTPFIRIAAAGGIPRRAEVLAPDGMVLGLNLDGGERFERCLEEVALPVAPGDVFLFFTDGISEAMDGDGAYFGESRLAAFLEANVDRPPDAIRDRLIDELGAFVQGQPQHDDITMVILRMEGLRDR